MTSIQWISTTGPRDKKAFEADEWTLSKRLYCDPWRDTSLECTRASNQRNRREAPNLNNGKKSAWPSSGIWTDLESMQIKILAFTTSSLVSFRHALWCSDVLQRINDCWNNTTRLFTATLRANGTSCCRNLSCKPSLGGSLTAELSSSTQGKTRRWTETSSSTCRNQPLSDRR